MATVDILLPAFGIKWAQDGTVEAIDEAQWRAGWSFIGATPPSVEQFNKVHQIQDEKNNYLYAQMAAIYTAAGVTPAAGTLTSLRDAIRLLTGVYGTLIATRVFSTPGTSTYTPTAGTRLCDVEVLGAGAAGGGTTASPGVGSIAFTGGGSAGSYARGVYPVASLTGQTITVGAKGVGVAATGGISGGASSIGAVVTAPGGGGSSAGGSITPGSTPQFGGGTQPSAVATGGNIVNARGAAAEYGTFLSSGNFNSGAGGASVFGAGGGRQNGQGAGLSAGSPGGGGGGALTGAGGPALAGGDGANGLVIIREYA